MHADIILPKGAAAFLADREALWTLVERMEGRKDAQLAREINLALPHELDAIQRRELLLNFVREAFVSQGMVADVAIHAPVPEKGDHPHNHHAHILLTLRQATALGLRPVKTREWNSDRLLTEWRALWARHQNRALAQAGLTARVDHRTLETQRKAAVKRGDRRAAAAFERKPEVHLGKIVRPRPHFGSNIAELRVIRTIKLERNAARLSKNTEQAQRRLEMWRRAFVQQLLKPRPKSAANRGASKLLPTVAPMRLAVDLRRLTSGPPNLSLMLARLGDGMAAWEIILRARLARQADFRGRYLADALLRELSRGSGRQRGRVRQLALPQHSSQLPCPGSASNTRGWVTAPPQHFADQRRVINQIAQRLARVLARLISHKH